MQVTNTTHPITAKHLRLLALSALVLLVLAEPAHAQAWAQKAVSVGEQIVNGL